MEWKSSNFLIRYYRKVRQNDPNNYFDLINFWIFPFIGFLNFIFITLFFASETASIQGEMTEELFNKILVYVIVLFLWGLFPIISLIKKPYDTYRANTLFFGSFAYYTILLNNMLIFYIAFFITVFFICNDRIFS